MGKLVAPLIVGQRVYQRELKKKIAEKRPPWVRTHHNDKHQKLPLQKKLYLIWADCEASVPQGFLKTMLNSASNRPG